MIIFDQLGKLGRLGNQLFQIAATLTHAQKVGDVPAFNKWEFQECFTKLLPELPENETGKLIVNGISHEMVHHTQFHYEPLPDRKNLYMLGFFQSEKYFDPKIIREYFTPSIMQVEKTRQATIKIFGKQEIPYGTLAIHVRRGDYANSNGYHPILPMDYYKNAFEVLQYFASGTPFSNPANILFFSDDIQFCKQNFSWVPSGINLFFSENDVVTDLFLAAGCSYFFIANSALSWWMAYLAKLLYKPIDSFVFAPQQHIVFAPRHWFGNMVGHNTGDLYCKNWIFI